MKEDYPEVFFSEYKGVRNLHLGTEDWIQGSMRMRKPFEIELEYVQRMMAWLLFVAPESVAERHAMQLGLGAAAITKFCHKYLQMSTTAVELNPHVVAMCHSWFSLPQEDEKLHIIIDDAAKVIHDEAYIGKVDALCVDIYDEEARAPVIDTVELYAQCKKLLTDEGMMTVNLFGRHHSFNQSLQNIAEGFGCEIDANQKLIWQFNPTYEGNTIVLAMAKPLACTSDILQKRAQTIEEQWGLPACKWLNELKRAEFIRAKKKQ